MEEREERRGGGYIAEVLNVPRVVFAGPMAGKVGRGDICDCFGFHANDLRDVSLVRRNNNGLTLGLALRRSIEGIVDLCCWLVGRKPGKEGYPPLLETSDKCLQSKVG